MALAQWGTCLTVGVWLLFFYDWEDMQTPLPVFRDWIHEQAESIKTGEKSTKEFPGFIEANIAKDPTKPR